MGPTTEAESKEGQVSLFLFSGSCSMNTSANQILPAMNLNLEEEVQSVRIGGDAGQLQQRGVLVSVQ